MPAQKTIARIAAAVVVVVMAAHIGFYMMAQLPPSSNRLALGATAPVVSLQDRAGQTVQLTSVTKGALPVLVFYRGHW